jgi:hypothetical protein
VRFEKSLAIDASSKQASAGAMVSQLRKERLPLRFKKLQYLGYSSSRSSIHGYIHT